MRKKIKDLFESPMEKIKMKHKIFIVTSSLYMTAFDIWKSPKLNSKKSKIQTTRIPNVTKNLRWLADYERLP